VIIEVLADDPAVGWEGLCGLLFHGDTKHDAGE
jgi:hypothetical protein